jgi:hypothetical protein
MEKNKQSTLGVIIGNRDFFPDQLVAPGMAIAKGSEPLHTNYLDSGFVEQDFRLPDLKIKPIMQ